MRFYTASKLGSKRAYTKEGFLVCLDVPIARTGEMVYAGTELPELEAGRDGLIRVQRDAAAVFDPVAMASFVGKPTTNDHPPEMVSPENFRRFTAGSAQNIRQGTPGHDDLLYADLLFADPATIADIEGGKDEISCGYDADYELVSPGVYRQVEITGNHVAVVAEGRCGARCAIGDAKFRDEPAFQEEDHPRGEGGQFTTHQQKMHALADHMDRIGADERYGETQVGNTEEAYNRQRALAGDVKALGKHADGIMSNLAKVASPEIEHGNGIASEIKDGLYDDLKDSAADLRTAMRDPDLAGFVSKWEKRVDIRPQAIASAAAIRGLADEGQWIERTSEDGDSDFHPDDLDALADHADAVNRVMDDFLSTAATSGLARHRTNAEGKRELQTQNVSYASNGTSVPSDLRARAAEIREDGAHETHDARLRRHRASDQATTPARKSQPKPLRDTASVVQPTPLPAPSCGCGGQHHRDAAAPATPARSPKRKTRDMATKPTKIRGSMLDRLRRAVSAKDEAGFEEAMSGLEETVEASQEEQAQEQFAAMIGEAVASAIAPLTDRMSAVETDINDRKTRDAEEAAAKVAERKRLSDMRDRRTRDTDVGGIREGVDQINASADPSAPGASGSTDSAALVAFLTEKGLSDADIAQACALMDAGEMTRDDAGDIGGDNPSGTSASSGLTTSNNSEGGNLDARGTRDSVRFAAVFRNVVANAEILAPGVRLPSFDAKAKPQATADAMCALRRRALKSAFDSADRKVHVAPFLDSAAPDFTKMTCDAIKIVFAGASELAKRGNAPTFGATDAAFMARNSGTRDTIAEMNDAASKLWKPAH